MTQKRGILACLLVLAIPLGVAATAFACGSLATLKLNRATAGAGDPVRAAGGNFNSSAQASTVQVRFNGRNGRVLWEGRPNANGRLIAAFDAPAARPGYYVIVATQTGPDGRPAAGTPGRAPLRIKPASGSSRSAEAFPAAPGAPPVDGAGPQAAPVSEIAIGVLAVGLVGGALTLVSARRPRRPSPVQTTS